jgi:hypothetical protein
MSVENVPIQSRAGALHWLKTDSRTFSVRSSRPVCCVEFIVGNGFLAASSASAHSLENRFSPRLPNLDVVESRRSIPVLNLSLGGRKRAGRQAREDKTVEVRARMERTKSPVDDCREDAGRSEEMSGRRSRLMFGRVLSQK